MPTLTDDEMVDVRRHAGYPLAGADPHYADPVAVATRGAVVTLTFWLANLTPQEEDVLRAAFLVPLAALETGVLGAADNMDTQSAGPWTANPQELAERTRLFDGWRRRMCAYIGVAPGPGLGDGGVTLVRC